MDFLTQIPIYIGVLGALVGAFKAINEYVERGVQNRAKAFFDLHQKYMFDRNIRNICLLLDLESEGDDSKLIKSPGHHRFLLIDTYEQIALMLNPRLIELPVAHYMFGYYAIKCRKSTAFWKISKETLYDMENYDAKDAIESTNTENSVESDCISLEPNSPYWALFRDFADKMEAFAIENKFNDAAHFVFDHSKLNFRNPRSFLERALQFINRN